jgi:hypothetical protein
MVSPTLEQPATELGGLKVMIIHSKALRRLVGRRDWFQHVVTTGEFDSARHPVSDLCEFVEMIFGIRIRCSRWTVSIF